MTYRRAPVLALCVVNVLLNCLVAGRLSATEPVSWISSGENFTPAEAQGIVDLASHEGLFSELHLPLVTPLDHLPPPAVSGPSLADLRQLALQHNPTLVQASFEVRAILGMAYQAGLSPNPVAGYVGDQIGTKGTAGEMQGGFISQEIVTGGKLRLSRAKYCQRARMAETNVFVQQLRVVNDVEVLFYRVLAFEEVLTVCEQLLANTQDALLTSREMLNVGQANKADVLRAEVDVHRDGLLVETARLDVELAWRTLVAVVGVPNLTYLPLEGELFDQNAPLDWDEAVAQLLEGSPELVAARQHVRHDQISVARERVQPVPNILLDARGGQNFESGNTVAGVQAGLVLPIFDRNRGTIRQAEADLVRSRANVRRLELELRSRLAEYFGHYQVAWNYVQKYRDVMLPTARQAYELLQQNYQARRVAWPEVLATQREYLQLKVQYLERVAQYHEADVFVRGMLLTGGLVQPPSTISEGHIDSVPKPR
jgi:cobalt-zinc-cadmium efflux system outer membrane protein